LRTQRDQRRSGQVWRLVAAAVTALSGLLSLISAITPDVGWRENLLNSVEPGQAIAFEHVLAAGAGLAQLVLAWGLMHRKRRAATATIAILCGSAVVHMAKGLDFEESAVALALAALLYVNRSAFGRGGDRRARPGLVAAALAVGAVTAGYSLYITKLLVEDRARTLGTAMTSAHHALVTGGWWLRSGDPLSVSLDVLLLISMVAIAAFLRAWLAPAQAADGHTCEEHRRAAAIVAEHAADSLAPFLLREDKTFFFSHGGVLAYRTLRETAVVSSDPVGPPGQGPSILADFLGYAEQRGWGVVMTAASKRYLPEYEALGLRALCIGNEAVVDPGSFSLEGRAMRKVRQSVHRLERRGYSIEVAHERDLTPGLADQLALVDSRWQAAQPRMQGFAMTLGRLWGADEDASSVYVMAREPDGEVTGFLHFVSYPGGLSLDAMRRLGGEPNGLNEALVSRALEHARELGVTEVSLNFAGFAHLMAADAALKRHQKVLRWLLERFHGRFQLERLASFNRKFAPSSRPRYLVYGDRTNLPIAALRVLQAEAYVRPPRPRRIRSGWQPLARPVREASAAR
jgi:lysyl-tRNA synthetase class 2